MSTHPERSDLRVQPYKDQVLTAFKEQSALWNGDYRRAVEENIAGRAEEADRLKIFLKGGSSLCQLGNVNFLLETEGLPYGDWSKLPGYRVFDNLVRVTTEEAKTSWNREGIKEPLTLVRVAIPQSVPRGNHEQRFQDFSYSLFQQLDSAAKTIAAGTFNGVINVAVANINPTDCDLPSLNQVLTQKGLSPIDTKRALSYTKQYQIEIIKSVLGSNVVFAFEDTYARDMETSINSQDNGIRGIFTRMGILKKFKGVSWLIATADRNGYDPYKAHPAMGSVNIKGIPDLVLGNTIGYETVSTQGYVEGRAEKLTHGVIEGVSKALGNKLGLAIVRAPEGYGKTEFLSIVVSRQNKARDLIADVAQIMRVDGRFYFMRGKNSLNDLSTYERAIMDGEETGLPLIVFVDEPFFGKERNHGDLLDSIRLASATVALTKDYDKHPPTVRGKSQTFFVVFQPNAVEVPEVLVTERDKYLVDIEPDVVSYRTTSY